MCEHTMEIVHASMYYYTKQKPEEISYDSYFGFQEDLEYTTKKQTYIYKYTGYINLNDTKIFRTRINKKLDDEKRKEYERHIESWTVRGHYRTIKGKKVWIKDHIRGEGVLENRIYGTVPESEVLLIPKEIECERDVRVSVKKKSYTRDELVYLDESLPTNHEPKPEPPIPTKPPETPIQVKMSTWQRIKILFQKISIIIFKNNKNEN